MARNNHVNSFHLDLKMFALANSKELLNHAAMIVCQKCIDFQADLMTFSSVKENKPDWYAFEYAKKRADEYSYKGVYRQLSEMPSDFLQPYKEALEQCGKLLGNNGVVFITFVISELDCTIKTMALHSCPEGFHTVYSSQLKAAWGRCFEKPLSNPVYVIGKDLVPHELFNPPNYTDIDFSRYENDSMSEMNDKITTAAETRYRKAEKKKLENLKTADPKIRQGYYLVTSKNAEVIPFEKKKEKATAPQPEATPKSGQNNYSQQECFDIAVAYMKKHLDNPGSLKIHSSRVKDGGPSFTFSIDYSVRDKFGRNKRETYHVLVKAVSGSVDAAWSH